MPSSSHSLAPPDTLASPTQAEPPFCALPSALGAEVSSGAEHYSSRVASQQGVLGMSVASALGLLRFRWWLHHLL